jgi:hypothetical protein
MSEQILGGRMESHGQSSWSSVQVVNFLYITITMRIGFPIFYGDCPTPYSHPPVGFSDLGAGVSSVDIGLAQFLTLILSS